MAKTDVQVPFIRTPYNYDRSSASDDSGLICPELSLAQQQFGEESDINTIVKRFNLTGQLPVGMAVPQYGDFESVVDYHSALNLVIEADRAFMALPAHVRSRFNNDAGLFVDFVSNPENKGEAEKLGLTVGIGKKDLDAIPQESSQEASPKGAAVA